MYYIYVNLILENDLVVNFRLAKMKFLVDGTSTPLSVALFLPLSILSYACALPSLEITCILI